MTQDSRNAVPPKPRAGDIRPEITKLPHLHAGRRLFRRVLFTVMRLLTWLFVDLDLRGINYAPREGSIIVVTNHLGDADVFIGWALTTRIDSEVMVKSELHSYPVLRQILDAYGVIWVHRGQPDRRAIRAVLEGLEDNRMIGIAPEGRESLTGGLEEGTHGAAYLALKSGVPILPVTFTGTENAVVLENIKNFRKTEVSMVIGEPFHLDSFDDRRKSLEIGTKRIMKTLAAQLPERYRGAYTDL